VESWFFPAPGDEPYAFVHVRDEPASGADLKALGVAMSGTRVTVPLAAARLPPGGRLRALVSQLVQLRPILEDPSRALHPEQPGPERAPPDRRSAVSGDRPGAQADRRRGGAARRRSFDRRAQGSDRPRPGRAARAQRPPQGRL